MVVEPGGKAEEIRVWLVFAKLAKASTAVGRQSNGMSL